MPAESRAMTVVVTREALPARAVQALAALLAFCLLAVGTVRLSGHSVREPDAPTAVQRSLRFADGADGSVQVFDARSGALLDSVHGEAGFLRGSLRALARERKKRGLDGTPPFELVARTDGRLTLLDPATGERLDLESFGPTNAAVYRRWLDTPAASAVAAR
jgi:putative photosynthetic complex assembly protein